MVVRMGLGNLCSRLPLEETSLFLTWISVVGVFPKSQGIDAGHS